MSVTPRDLPESTLGTGIVLHCPECGTDWSATRGDYFWVGLDEPFVCGACCAGDDSPLELVRRIDRAVYVPVQA